MRKTSAGIISLILLIAVKVIPRTEDPFAKKTLIFSMLALIIIILIINFTLKNTNILTHTNNIKYNLKKFFKKDKKTCLYSIVISIILLSIGGLLPFLNLPQTITDIFSLVFLVIGWFLLMIGLYVFMRLFIIK